MSTLLSACSFFTSDELVINEPAVAQAYEQSLYPSDLKDLVQAGASSKDSINRVDSFIENWLRQQSIIAEAKKDTNLDRIMIERKVNALRDQLLLYEYQKNFLKNNLDTIIGQAEIDTFYNRHKEDFKLTQNVFKGLFIKISKSAPDVAQTISQFYSSANKQALAELKTYSTNFATSYYIQDTSWIYVDKVIQGTPYESSNQRQMLTSYKYSQRVDKDFHYLLKINDYKLIGSQSPPELHQEEIKALLIGQRKQKLLSDLENNMYERAVKAKEITRFD